MRTWSARREDVWGFAHERVEDERQTVRRPRRRHRVRLAALAAVLAAGLAGAPVASALSTGAVPLPHGIAKVALDAGEHPALDDLFIPIAASSGGLVVETMSRLGNGSSNANAVTNDTLATGSKTLDPFPAPPNSEVLGSDAVAGNYAAFSYFQSARTDVEYRDLKTGATGKYTVPSDASYVGPTASGILLSANTTPPKLEQYVVATKTLVLVSTFTSVPSVLVTGANGAIVNESGTYEYVTYTGTISPYTVPVGFELLACRSVTTNAAGCVGYESPHYLAVRMPIPSGSLVISPQATVADDSSVLVTSTETAWLGCAAGAASCTLFRQPAAGGSVTHTNLARPTGYGGGIVSNGSSLLLGLPGTSPAAGGLFTLGATATMPSRLLTGAASPLRASGIAVGTGSVIWDDSSKPGLALYMRTVILRPHGVAVGVAREVSSLGYVSSDASSYGLSLGDVGTSLAFTGYLAQPSKEPLGVYVDSGHGPRKVDAESDGVASSGGAPTAGPAIQLAGSFALFQSVAYPTTWSLYDSANGHTCALPAKNKDYALGPGEKGDPALVRLTSTGEVIEAPPGCAAVGGTVLLNPKLGADAVLESVLGLYVSGDYVTWAYSWYHTGKSGYEDGWINSTAGGVHHFPGTIVPSDIIAMSLSTTDIGLTIYSSAQTRLYTLTLPSGGLTLITTDGYDFSVGDNAVAWISTTTGTPYAGKP